LYRNRLAIAVGQAPRLRQAEALMRPHT